MDLDSLFSRSRKPDPLDEVDTRNHDKIKILLDRLEDRVLRCLLSAAGEGRVLSVEEIRREFREAKTWGKWT